MTEESILRQVLSTFSYPFSTKENVRWNEDIIYDAIVCYKTIPYVLVEAKRSLGRPQPTYQNLIVEKKAINCYWCIITDGATCMINGGLSEVFKECSFTDAIKMIKDVTLLAKNTPSDMLREIKLIFSQYGYDSFKTKIEIVPTANTESVVVFRSKQSERKFFEKIIGKTFNVYEGRLHKYTSFRTVFESIKHYSLRLNGIAGMNDKSEGYYWDEAVNEKKRMPSESINDYYISSFSTKEDNLTLWRLYGDDGKGICMTFRLRPNMNHNQCVLGSLKYAAKEDECFKLVKAMKTKHFVYQDIDQWKCFIKPKEYEDEEEYRLVLREKNGEIKAKEKEYYITNDSSIVNPYIILDMNSPDFPLKLEKITLGPKCPALEENIKQFMSLMRSRGIQGVTIEHSKVETYR